MQTFRAIIRSFGLSAILTMNYFDAAPAISSSMFDPGISLFNAQRYRDAANFLSRNAAFTSADAIGHFYLASSLKCMGKEREARNEYWISYLLDPQSPYSRLCQQALVPEAYQIDVPLGTDEYSEFQIRGGKCVLSVKAIIGTDKKLAGECKASASINVLIERGSRSSSRQGGFEIAMQPDLSLENQKYDAEVRRLSNPKEKQRFSAPIYATKSLSTLRAEYLQTTTRIKRDYCPFIQNQPSADQLKHIFDMREKDWISERESYKKALGKSTASNRVAETEIGRNFSIAKLCQSPAAMITLSSSKLESKTIPVAHIVIYPCNPESMHTTYQKTSAPSSSPQQLQKNLQRDEAFLGVNHLVVAGDLLDLASSYVDARRIQEILPLCQRAREIYEKGILDRKPVATTLLRKMASLCQKQGNYSEAEQYFKRAIEIDQAMFGQNSTKLFPALHDLVILYTTQNRLGEAEIICRREVSIEKASGGVAGLMDLVKCFILEGRYSESESILNAALSRTEKVNGDQENSATILCALADVYSGQGRVAEAELASQRALAIRNETPLPGKENGNRAFEGKDDLSANMVQLAGIYLKQRRFDEAENLCNRARLMDERRFGSRHLNIAISMDKLADIYAKRKRFADAEVFLKRSLAIKEHLGGIIAELAIAETLGFTAQLYNRLGRYKDAESLLKRALATEEKILGKQHQRVVGRIRQLASTYEGEGRYSEAESLLQAKVQSGAQEILGKPPVRQRSSLEQNSLERLAIEQINALKNLNKGKANDYVNNTVELVSSQSNDDAVASQALIYESLKLIKIGCAPVNLNQRLCRIWEKFAPQLIQKCGTKFNATTSDESKSLGDEASKYVDYYGSQDMASQAAFRTCLALACLLLDNVDEVYDGLDNSDHDSSNTKALQLVSAAEELSVMAGGTADEKLDRLLSLADFFRLDGEYVRARNCITRALRNNDASAQAVLRANVKLAELLIEQSDGSSATSVAEAAVQNSAALLAQDLEMKQRLLKAIATGAQIQKDFDKAEKFASENLALSQQLFGPGSKEFLEAQTILCAARTALFELNSRNMSTESQLAAALSKQLTNLKTAIDAVKSKANNNDPSYAILCGNALSAKGSGHLALLTANKNSKEPLDETRLCFAQAFDYHRPNPARNGIAAIVRDLNGMAACDALAGNLNSARGLAFESAYYLSDYIKGVFPALSFAEQIAFLQTVKDEINVLLEICNDGYSISRTYEYLICWRGLLVESMRRQTSLISEAAQIPEQKRLVEQLQFVKAQLVSALSDETATDNQVRQLTLRKEMLERDVLFAAEQRGGQEDIMPTMTTDKFSSILSETECFLDLYRYRTINKEEHFAAILVLKQNRPVFIDIPNAEIIDDAITDWRTLCIRQGLENPATDLASAVSNSTSDGQSNKNKSKSKDAVQTELASDSAADEKLRNSCLVLQKNLLKPIEDALQKLPAKTDKLIICDESSLARIPWGMISPEFFLLASDAKEVSSAGQRFSICHFDSPREFVRLHSAGASGNLKKMLLAGGVKYKNTPILKGSEAELEDLSLLAKEKGVQPTSLSGSAPTPSSIKSELEKCSIAHLATHGFFINTADLSGDDKAQRLWSLVSVRNPLIDSGLVLAPESNTSELNSQANEELERKESSDVISRSFHEIFREGGASGESLLTADEIVGLDLRKCELVTLSACETGLGVEEKGQGILGLRSAFMSAGVRSVLVSLWPVSDKATRFFMQRFYSYLWDNKSKSEALRLAQTDVKNYKAKNWQHPKYWAAWILVGQGW